MTAHTKEQREFIALRLARVDLPAEIIAAFTARWPDTACALDDVMACDPDEGGVLAPDTWDAFQAERTRVLKDPSYAPTTDKRFRQRIRDRMIRVALRNRQYLFAADLLDRQAKEEQGGQTPPGDEGPVTAITRTIVDPAPAVAAAE